MTRRRRRTNSAAGRAGRASSPITRRSGIAIALATLALLLLTDAAGVHIATASGSHGATTTGGDAPDAGESRGAAAAPELSEEPATSGGGEVRDNGDDTAPDADAAPAASTAVLRRRHRRDLQSAPTKQTKNTKKSKTNVFDDEALAAEEAARKRAERLARKEARMERKRKQRARERRKAAREAREARRAEREAARAAREAAREAGSGEESTPRPTASPSSIPTASPSSTPSSQPSEVQVITYPQKIRGYDTFNVEFEVLCGDLLDGQLSFGAKARLERALLEYFNEDAKCDERIDELFESMTVVQFVEAMICEDEEVRGGDDGGGGGEATKVVQLVPGFSGLRRLDDAAATDGTAAAERPGIDIYLDASLAPRNAEAGDMIAASDSELDELHSRELQETSFQLLKKKRRRSRAKVNAKYRCRRCRRRNVKPAADSELDFDRLLRGSLEYQSPTGLSDLTFVWGDAIGSTGRLLDEDCDADLVEELNQVGFEDVKNATVEAVYERDCSVGSDDCSGADGEYGCCGIAGCACKTGFVSESLCGSAQCDIAGTGDGDAGANLCCELDPTGTERLYSGCVDTCGAAPQCSSQSFACLNSDPDKDEFNVNSALSIYGFCPKGADGTLTDSDLKFLNKYLLDYANEQAKAGGCSLTIRYDSVEVAEFTPSEGDCKGQDDPSVVIVDATGPCLGEYCACSFPEI